MTALPYDVTADPTSRYYLGPRQASIPSGHQLRAEIAGQVDAETRRGWAGDLFGDPDSAVNRRYQQAVAGDTARLAEGLQVRQHGGPPSSAYDFMSHEDMNQLINTDAEPATVSAQSEKWVEIGNALAEFQSTFASAINGSTQSWHGAAAENARGFTADLARWVGEAGRGAQLAGNQQQIHSQTLNETQKQMAANPPTSFSMDGALANLQTITDPVAYAQESDAVWQDYENASAARDQAAQLMTDFDTTVGAATTTPVFGPPPTLTESGSPQQPPGAPPLPPPALPPPGRPRPEQEPPPPQWQERPWQPTRDPVSGTGDTTTAGADPDAGRQVLPGGRDPSGPGDRLAGAARTGPDTGYGPGAPGMSRSGPGAADPRGGSGGRTGSGAPGGGRSGGVGRYGGGAGTGGAGVRPDTAAGRSGAGGSKGFGGAMGAPGARGQGEDDKEHKSPAYLVDERNAEIFLPDGLVTPETIGELERPDRDVDQ